MDLKEYNGDRPVELFGRANFPFISDHPYLLTLSPHAAFWFLLQPVHAVQREPVPTMTHEISVPTEHWEEVFEPEWAGTLEQCLSSFLRHRRWFRSKGREIRAVQIRDTIRVPLEPDPAFILLLTVEFVEGDPEDYLLPLAIARGEQAGAVLERTPQLALARVGVEHGNRRSCTMPLAMPIFAGRSSRRLPARRPSPGTPVNCAPGADRPSSSSAARPF